MTLPEVLQAVRLAVLGALAVAALQQFWHFRARRDDRVHLAAGAWFAVGAVFVAGRFIRNADLAPGALLVALRTHYSVGLFAVPVGLLLVRRIAALPPTGAFRALVAASALVSLLPWSSDLFLQGALDLHVDALGVAFRTPRPGVLYPALFPYLASTVAYVVWVLRRRSTTSEPGRRWLVIVTVALLGPLAANDALVDVGVLRGVKILEVAFAVQLFVVSGYLARRSGVLFTRLEEAVRTRLEEIRGRKADLHQALAGVRSLIDALPDAVLVHSDARIRFANRAVAAQLGWDPEALVGRPVTDLVPTDRADDALADALRLERAADVPAVREEEFLREDGRRIVCEVAGLAFDFEGKRAALETLRDVTELREIEGQLRRADRLASVGTLAAGVAHEINNPLTYVTVNVSHVRSWIEEVQGRTGRAAGTGEARLRQAAAAAERIRRTVLDLQTFSRADDVSDGRVAFGHVVEIALSMGSGDVERRARIVRDLGPTPDVVGNAARVANLVLHLLIHAARALPDGAPERHRIRVSTFTGPNGGAVLEIAGMGPWVGGDRSELDLCGEFARSMGGTISIGDAPDGPSVRVAFPAAPPASAPTSRTLAARSRGRILVVDDEPLVARAVRRLLSDHDVVVASDGEEALEICARESFDVVLCDVMMPGISGVEVYERLRARDPAWAERFVFVTGGAFAQDIAEALDATGIDRVVKPIDGVRLRDVVAARIRAH